MELCLIMYKTFAICRINKNYPINHPLRHTWLGQGLGIISMKRICLEEYKKGNRVKVFYLNTLDNLIK